MRDKKKTNELIDRDQAVKEVKQFADATSNIKRIEAAIELEVQRVKEKFEKELSELNDKRNSAFDKLQYFAEFNKNKLFTERKSLDMVHGIIGFRTGTPKVNKARSISWEAALAELKKINENFVRTKEEVNKEEIIEMRDDDKTMLKLSKVGITVVRDENFYVEAKAEELVEF